MARNMVDYRDSPNESKEQYGVGNSSHLELTMRSLKDEIRSCKADNDRIMQAQEKQTEVNAMILQSLLDL